MTEKYHIYISWMPKDDESVRNVFLHVMGKPLHRDPRVHKINGRLLIGNGEMTKEKQAKIESMLGSKVKLTEKMPFMWMDK